MWYIFDHRTARRIRLKFDAGLFFNLSKFNQHDLDWGVVKCVNLVGNRLESTFFFGARV